MSYRFKRLPQMERDLVNSRNYKFETFSLPTSGEEELKLNGFTCRRSDGNNGYYYNEKIKKERIILHFTAGYLSGDIPTLSRKDYHVSVPFVIGRDGTIFQLHGSNLWSYHLGKAAVGGNTVGSKSSIGIEISNIGYLTPRNGNLESAYSRVLNKGTGRRNPEDLYCSLADESQYVRLEKPFRGKEYFATYTDMQYDSLIILLRYLTNTYDIPKVFLPVPQRYDTFEMPEQALGFRGIASHVNYRQSGKWDIGPAFDWEQVEKGLLAETYSSNFAVKSKGLSSIGFPSERAIEDAFPAGSENEYNPDVYGEDGPEV